MDNTLRREREHRDENALQRSLRLLDGVHGPEIEWQGRRLVNFSSNDYLGLAQRDELKIAANCATQRWGAGAGAARLICGSLPCHAELEKTIAQFKGTAAALSFSSGYAAAVGTICALVGARDIVIVDKLVHASLVDGARLSGAKLRVFRHNDIADLRAILEWAAQLRSEAPATRILIVTESVFSMDGDCAPLAEIVAAKEEFGAWLMVDEAHALGVLGPQRRGLAEELGVGGRIEAQMGTLGKSVGASGGFIVGSEALIDHLINSARSFIFSTAPAPSCIAAAQAGIELIASSEGELLRQQLQTNIRMLTALVEPSLLTNSPGSATHATAIVPVIFGDETRALAASDKLKEAGFFVPAIRYPTVARGKARLRVTVSAAHTEDQIGALATAINVLKS